MQFCIILGAEAIVVQICSYSPGNEIKNELQSFHETQTLRGVFKTLSDVHDGIFCERFDRFVSIKLKILEVTNKHNKNKIVKDSSKITNEQQ